MKSQACRFIACNPDKWSPHEPLCMSEDALLGEPAVPPVLNLTLESATV